MKDWSKDEAFTSWTEAQKRLWESLSTGVPAFQPPKSMGIWRDTYLKNLSAWEGAVKQSLDMQSAWVKQWARQVASEQGTPESMGEWTQQVEEVMQHWIDTQSKLWEDWFEMLRSTASGGGPLPSEVQAPAAPPVPEPPAFAPAPREEPSPQPSPPAAEAKEPSPVQPEAVPPESEAPPAAKPAPAKPKTSKSGTAQRRTPTKKKGAAKGDD